MSRLIVTDCAGIAVQFYPNQTGAIPPTDSYIRIYSTTNPSYSELHLNRAGIYYVYCQVSLARVELVVQVSMRQGSTTMAEGVVGNTTMPRTVFLGRLICVNGSDIITVHIQPAITTDLQRNGARTYLGAFLVDDRPGCINNEPTGIWSLLLCYFD